MTSPPSIVGMTDDMAGRMMPSICLTVYMQPTIMAPVLPALANPSIFPSVRERNPTAMLESGF